MRSQVFGALVAAAALGASGLLFAQPDVQTSSTALKETLVWSGLDVPFPSGGITADGRSLVFAGDNLYIRDLTANKTEIRPSVDGSASDARPSPDGQWIAIGWADFPSRTRQLRAVPFRGGTPKNLHQVSTGTLSPLAWTHDGKEVVAWIGSVQSGGSLSAFSIVTGQQRVFTTRSDGGIDAAAVSPDGGRIAYSTTNELRIVNSDGSGDSILFADATGAKVMSWTPTGTHLLFLSNREGSLGAWIIQVTDRKVIGTPRLIKSRLERSDAVGFGADGRFYVHVMRGGVDSHVVPVDPATGLRRGVVSNLPGREPGVRRHQGIWAPDNRRIAYLRNAPLTPAAVVVLDTTTGRTQNYPVQARVVERLVWHPSGQKIAMIVEDASGQGVLQLDLTSGSFAKIHGATNAVDYSPDGDHLMYRRPRTADAASSIVKRHLSTGVETVLYTGNGAFFAAPDGISFLLYRPQARSLWFAPAGGKEMQLVPEMPDSSREVAISRNGKYAYYGRTSPWEIWMVPTAGGTPVPLGVNIEGVDRITTKPDGTGLLLSGGTASLEVWAWQGIR